MKRINGFLNLDEYFRNKKIHEGDIVEGNSHYQYWLKINGEKYFYKYTQYPYVELLCCEIAKFLGLKAVSYDLAIFNEIEGVISKSYRKNNSKYISGFKILRDYLKSKQNIQFLKEMGLKNKDYFLNMYLPRDINNLEVIWQAIEQRYAKLEIPIDIEKIMSDFVNLFIFNILTSQNDGLPHNWELQESKEGVSLVLIYDNEYAFKEGAHSKLTTNFNDSFKNNYIILKEFLKISSQEYVDLFLEKFNMLTKEVFLELIQIVENKTQSEIPMHLKSWYITFFIQNRNNIKNVLDALCINQKR